MENPIRDVAGFIGFLFLFFIVHGFRYNAQVLPPLDQIRPVTRTISAAKQEFTGGKRHHLWIDIRLAGIPVIFAINYLDRLHSDSEVYKSIVNAIRISDEVTVWAIPVGPGFTEAITFADINRKPLHELSLNTIEQVSTSLGIFQDHNSQKDDSDLLKYEVVQMEKNGRLLFSYGAIAKEIAANDKMFYWLWIVIAFFTAWLGLKTAMIPAALLFRAWQERPHL